jgi:hypothetical protein
MEKLSPLSKVSIAALNCMSVFASAFAGSNVTHSTLLSLYYLRRVQPTVPNLFQHLFLARRTLLQLTAKNNSPYAKNWL